MSSTGSKGRYRSSVVGEGIDEIVHQIQHSTHISYRSHSINQNSIHLIVVMVARGGQGTGDGGGREGEG